ncbi:MAG: phosphotransferase, partial [Actinomycetes bacterium]
MSGRSRAHLEGEQLPHGYTNRTVRIGDEVLKTYAGPQAGERWRREIAALTLLAGRVPVPPLVGAPEDGLRTRWIAGAHGQDLIDAGSAAEVLHACGGLLRHLQTIELPPTAGLPGASSGVLVHGDFGPNNVLMTPTFGIAAVVDWE